MVTNKRKVVALSLAVVTMISLSGCKKDPNEDPLLSEKKEGLIATIHEMESTQAALLDEIDSLNAQITELQEKNLAIQAERPPTPGIRELEDGTGRMTFFTIDGKLGLPSDLMYPNASSVSNTMAINISNSVAVKPTFGWTFKLTNAKLDLYHSTGITGQITVGSLSREAQKTLISSLDPYLREYLDQIPGISELKMSDLFVKQNKYGVDATCQVFVDDEPATLRCGIVGYSDVAVQYCFYFMGTQNSSEQNMIEESLNKLETLEQLINSVEIYASPLSIGN